ncbi:lasso RiPP family leader peptide-containing protein [Spirosoma sp. KCTC 42546]|nr:lasso RiPP family leader peptide-containing protein [Spirosoma sp. KCTC 42546]QDK80199.1 lasso RiPP family leader peptide-containing protein [Spirosoma sp. KCTC 42546]
MKLKSKTISTGPAKKAYQTPKLTGLGNVKKLTLKTGSNVDGFGGTFV